MRHVKYPRTPHLPWSPGFSVDDKKLGDVDGFVGRRVVVTTKMDGECTTMYADHIHARSVRSRGHVSRDWVKAFWAERAGSIPAGWRVCGENLWARHSIGYDDLPSFFLGFSVWDATNYCLSWDESANWFAMLGIEPVQIIYDGPFDDQAIRGLAGDPERQEGYVVRIADGFRYEEFGRSVAKFVRPGHVRTDEHWSRGKIDRNGLRIDR